MKKAILVLVIGLFWCSVGFAEVLNYVCQYKATDKKINIQLNLEKNQIKHGNKIEEIVVKNLTQVVFLKSGTFPSYRVFTYAPHYQASLQQVGVGIGNIELIKERLRKGDLHPIYANCSGDQIAKKPEEKKPKKKKPIEEDDDKIIIIGSGSGFFVSDKGHVVSNEHVVGVCKKVKAYEEGEEVFLNILATDMANDIGLVKGKFKNKEYLNIKTDGAELGEDIIAFGYPLSQTLSDSVKLTKGIVSSLTGLGNNTSQIQIDAAIQPGNSGGPVLNMNAQVVGIASAGLSKLYMLKKAEYIPENVNFAVASQTLTAFLKAHKISIGTSASRTLSTKQLAIIGEPATIQLFCMNTRDLMQN